MGKRVLPGVTGQPALWGKDLGVGQEVVSADGKRKAADGENCSLHI
jgi:hypothetical protein